MHPARSLTTHQTPAMATYVPTWNRSNEILEEAEKFVALALEQWELGANDFAVKASQMAANLATVAHAIERGSHAEPSRL